MKHLKKYEGFVDPAGNLHQSDLDQELQDEISREEAIQQFNDQLKEFTNKEYVFDVDTSVITWTSDSENTRHDEIKRKSYRLKTIKPNVSESFRNPGTLVASLKLKFVGGTILKRDNINIILTKDTFVEIPPAGAMEGPGPLRMKYNVHFDGDFDKKETFPKNSYFKEWYVADYPTQEKLKELRDIVELIENEANNANKDELY